MEQLILSCDWGTSSFRLRLINIDSMQVIGELITGEGTSATHKLWIAANQLNTISKVSFFFRLLKERIDDLVITPDSQLNPVHVIISGMASSSIGIMELPYASTPFLLDGSGLKYKFIEASEEFPFEVWIISGLSSGKDVMRGEETQVLGLAQTFSAEDRKDLICLLPGTHSKHIKIEDNCITGFETYMTGELFSIMSKHSVLRDVVSIQMDFSSLNSSCGEAFDKGVIRSGDSGLLNSLFSTRVNHLFGCVEKKENAFYLSGILIGSELRSLVSDKNTRIMVIGEEPLCMLYTRALTLLGLMKNTVFVNTEISANATVYAHVDIFNNVCCK